MGSLSRSMLTRSKGYAMPHRACGGGGRRVSFLRRNNGLRKQRYLAELILGRLIHEHILPCRTDPVARPQSAQRCETRERSKGATQKAASERCPNGTCPAFTPAPMHPRSLAIWRARMPYVLHSRSATRE